MRTQSQAQADQEFKRDAAIRTADTKSWLASKPDSAPAASNQSSRHRSGRDPNLCQERWTLSALSEHA
jgi:hypothetical protein